MEPQQMNRRAFIKESLLASAGGALAAQLAAREATAAAASAAPAAPAQPSAHKLPRGKIGDLEVSRVLLGGNLLTHYTHSRDLKYVYNLTAHYNTEAKILETLALAEEHGINTLNVHTVPSVIKILQTHRKRGGKIQWIICPTAPVKPDMQAYSEQAKWLIDQGADALYVWGVHSDGLLGGGKAELIGKCLEAMKVHTVPSGVGAHDLRVIADCEKRKVPTDFYIKTFHHHKYATGPKPEELKRPYQEIPGYWCKDPEETIKLMSTVEKPWIAFKVMAAGAIPPANAFQYVLNNGADHILAGMFDFEIAEDVRLANKALANVKRTRPWRS